MVESTETLSSCLDQILKKHGLCWLWEWKNIFSSLNILWNTQIYVQHLENVFAKVLGLCKDPGLWNWIQHKLAGVPHGPLGTLYSHLHVRLRWWELSGVHQYVMQSIWHPVTSDFHYLLKFYIQSFSAPNCWHHLEKFDCMSHDHFQTGLARGVICRVQIFPWVGE